MKKTIYFLLINICLCVAFFSCGNNTSLNQNQSTDSTQTAKDTSSIDSVCSSETIMDPNDTKPMALMMRMLVKNADEMKSKLQTGEVIDESKYPLIRFWLVEPTDPDVLEPQFFENARLFSETYKKLFLAKNNKEQIKAYNAVIGMCINCHQSYCSGPLKRIRKLPI